MTAPSFHSSASASTSVGPPSRADVSLARVLAEAFGLLVVLGAVGVWVLRATEAEPGPSVEVAALVEPPEPPPVAEPLPTEAAPDPEPVAVEPEPEPEPEPAGPDPEILAAAEAELESVREALRRAEREEARLVAERDEADLRALAAGREAGESAERSRAEAARVVGARANVAALVAERDRLAEAVAAIEAAPRPREALNTSQSPVARTITGEEYHFEVRGDRVAFIDLDRLLEEAQADARLRLRMTGGGRSAAGTVGPIGAFSMSYEVATTGIDLVSGPRGAAGVSASYALQGFEVVPANRLRGEPFEVIFSPASEFGRVIRRLDPARTSITLWVYPDGFPLYRRLWDALHASGFTVAARPLPEGMPIRGGPNGSRSAGQ